MKTRGINRRSLFRRLAGAAFGAAAAAYAPSLLKPVAVEEEKMLIDLLTPEDRARLQQFFVDVQLFGEVGYDPVTFKRVDPREPHRIDIRTPLPR